MGKTVLKNIEFWAHHGCFEEEQIIGNKYLVTVKYKSNTKEPEEKDNLSSAIDYQQVYEVVKNEMEIKSKLIENVAFRISNAILNKFFDIITLEIKISKCLPPIGGKMKQVSFILKSKK